MKENLEIIEKLANIKGESHWREDQLEKMGIMANERDDLLRKNLLKICYPSGRLQSQEFSLTDSAYALTQAKKTGEEEVVIAKQNLFWQKWGIIIAILSFGVAILALIVAIIALLKP